MNRAVAPPPAIIAVGRNYADHAREMGGSIEAHPTVFMKNPAATIGDGEAIVIPTICREHGPQVDFEGELAVVVGEGCVDVPESRALDFIAGFAVANDVSARWWQKQGSGGQFCRGKSFDTFCPIGAMRSAAEVGDPSGRLLTTRLNGELMQSSSTSLMLFSVPRIVAELSRGTTLLPGTIVLTGTPAGVGAGRTPPRFLRDGDVVEIEIEGIGSLRNPVREAD
jgi:2-keto-4-pentenoate hydratase/2-oxohepta-3-ene-1,7-dioic acid hydratase in catechol pathway